MRAQTTFSFDRDDLFTTLGFNARDRVILQRKSDDFVRAVLEVESPEASKRPAEREGVASSSSPLYIPGVRYHLNLSQAAKTALLGSLGIIAKAYLLQNAGSLEASVSLSSIAIAELIRQLTRLSNRQQRILDAIYELKRASPYPSYWPSTEEIAEKVDLPINDVDKELKPIVNKVVNYESDSKTWQIVL
jgi:hypothetical protein